MTEPAATPVTAHPRRKLAIWLTVGVVVVGLFVLVCIYRRFLLSGLDLIAEGTGSRLTALGALALGFLVLVWLIFWMLFPVFVFLGLRDLRRRTSELDRTTRLCARQLAILTTESHGPKPSEPTEQPPLAGRTS